MGRDARADWSAVVGGRGAGGVVRPGRGAVRAGIRRRSGRAGRGRGRRDRSADRGRGHPVALGRLDHGSRSAGRVPAARRPGGAAHNHDRGAAADRADAATARSPGRHGLERHAHPHSAGRRLPRPVGAAVAGRAGVRVGVRPDHAADAPSRGGQSADHRDGRRRGGLGVGGDAARRLAGGGLVRCVAGLVGLGGSATPGRDRRNDPGGPSLRRRIGRRFADPHPGTHRGARVHPAPSDRRRAHPGGSRGHRNTAGRRQPHLRRPHGAARPGRAAARRSGVRLAAGVVSALHHRPGAHTAGHSERAAGRRPRPVRGDGHLQRHRLRHVRPGYRAGPLRPGARTPGHPAGRRWDDSRGHRHRSYRAVAALGGRPLPLDVHRHRRRATGCRPAFQPLGAGCAEHSDDRRRQLHPSDGRCTDTVRRPARWRGDPAPERDSGQQSARWGGGVGSGGDRRRGYPAGSGQSYRALPHQERVLRP